VNKRWSDGADYESVDVSYTIACSCGVCHTLQIISVHNNFLYLFTRPYDVRKCFNLWIKQVKYCKIRVRLRIYLDINNSDEFIDYCTV
jgi:hypothetical protein